MQENTVTSFDRPAQPLVKPDPQMKKLDKSSRLSKWGIILFAFGTLLMVVTLILFFWFKRPLTILLPDLFIMLSSGGSILFLRFLTKSISKYWKRLEQRRQAAACGDQRLLAEEQPIAEVHAYTLPLTIRQSPRKVSFMLMSGSTFLSSIIGGSVTILFFTHIIPLLHHTNWPLSLVFLFIGICSLLGLAASIGFTVLMYTRVRQQITLTENGLMQVGLSRKVRSIPWSEARLFAILGIYGAKKYPSPALFELSSGNEIIRWNWLRKNSLSVWYFANSRVDTAEYERQMNGALSIIAAKTGLPLYDLRKELPE